MSLLYIRIDEYIELSHAPISGARSTNIFEQRMVANQWVLGTEIIIIIIITTTTKRDEEKEAAVTAPINP